MKTLLCVPPDYEHDYPPLGTPALSAFLKKNKVECLQNDLNLGYRDFLAAHVSGPCGLSHEERLFFLKPLLRRFFSRNLKGRYYSSFLPRDSDDIFPQIPYGNNTTSSFYFAERLMSSEFLWRYLQDRQENWFLGFYEDSGLLNTLENEGIGLLGISVTSPAQAIAALTLGLFVKKRLPFIHVTIGGQWATLYRDAILQRKELFRCFDSVVVFEGESALHELAGRLDARRDISSIPNVMTPGLVSFAAQTRREENMDLMPCPDFDGLPLTDYDASKDGRISLTYETSRGCYWGRCAYCVDLPLPKISYRRKDPALVVDDMRNLTEKYRAAYLLFSDPGLSPRQMRRISRRMIDQHVRMGWWTMARLDPGFDRRLFDLAHAAGLQQVNFGFESASDRVCGLLDKGNKRDRSSKIIRDCAQAGIKVDLQTMVGLPGESFEDGMETIDFLVSHREFISHVTFNIYYLTPFNFIHRDPAKYGLDYSSRPNLPFRFFIPFENRNGMDMNQAYLLEKMYHSLMNKDAACGSAPAAPGQVSEGVAALRLGNESCCLRYRRDEKTEVYTFVEDEAEPAQKHDPACTAP